MVYVFLETCALANKWRRAPCDWCAPCIFTNELTKKGLGRLKTERRRDVVLVTMGQGVF